MLNTEIQVSQNGLTIRLNGSLTGDSIQKLAELWKRIRGGDFLDDTRFDLSALTFIDEEGERFLQGMQQGGAQIMTEQTADERVLR